MRSRLIANIILVIAVGVLLFLHLLIQYSLPKEILWLLFFVDFVFLLFLTYSRIVAGVSSHLSRELQRKDAKLQLSQSDKSSERDLLITLRDILNAFGGEKDLHSILKQLVIIVKRFLKVDILFLELYSDEEQKYFARIYEGESEIPVGEKLREDVIQRGQSHLINNLHSFPRYRDLSDKGYISLIVAPLKRKDRHMGMIGAVTKKPHDFRAAELDLLSAIATQASLLIENAWLLEKTKLLSITDGLTNIYNHRHFQEKLQEEMKKVTNENRPLSLIMGDIDDFKHYNDNNGHLVGDKVLWKIAEIFKKNTKGRDVVARYGGEEFVIILPRTNRENAKEVAEKLRQEVEEYQFPGEEKQPKRNLTMCFGISSSPEDGLTPNELIEKADKRLYKAKRRGKNRVVWQ